MRIQLFLLGLFVSGAALAEPDTFGLGTGKDSSLGVDAPGTVINVYRLLTVNAAAGTTVLTLNNNNGKVFDVGDLVLVHQSTGLSSPPASGNQQTIDLGGTAVGRFEYARVASLRDTSLELTAPLQYSYAANVTQVVSVPEYTTLRVGSTGSIRATPWNGSVGGIVAFLANGQVTLSGAITADGAGFRGGAFINHSGRDNCSQLDQGAGNGGSYKGESVVAGRFGTAAGRGNLANGGGSGVCHNSGGAGGGHSGLGGKGGYTYETPHDTGGLGGTRLSYLPYEHLVFGGGGGGGGGHVDGNTTGGAGGGVIIIRAAEVTGTGQFSVTGSAGTFTASSIDDGAGGGGAGGAISVRTARGLSCTLARASGGVGGDTRHPTEHSGPGGGGGGGFIFLQGNPISCPASVVAGFPGQSTSSGDTYGAGPSAVDGGTSYGGQQSYEVPYQVPATPTLTQPEDGATGLSQRPHIEGTSDPGVIIHLFLDGVAYTQVVAGSAGVFTYEPSSDLVLGGHTLQASAEVFGAYSLPSTVNQFDVGEAPGDGGTSDGGTTSDGGSTQDGGFTQDGGVSGDAPILVVPQENEVVEALTLFAGMSPSGASVSIEVDGAEVAHVKLDDQRRFRYTLTAEQKLAPGAHTAVIRSWDKSGAEGPSSSTTHFEVGTSESPEAGCGCGASPGAGLGALVLLLGLGAARLRRSE
ncbi:adventurous gliding motility protein AgmC [Hyalangium versicolor]|uniref:adventurous gliding motility protein AgmC n=1 Tax=Hyalangium versicolor TaxID=2861190 RepID=UPI001CC95859|nr:hemagglutinin [Hyalangium versicolor]